MIVVLILNFRKPEKEPHHNLERLFDIKCPQLKREMGALLGLAIVPGNSVQPPENGDEIFASMLAAIDAAQHTITFETYIYWSGTVGERFTEALRERTHIMLDWVGCGKVSPEPVMRVKRAGIEVERYHAVR
jgi:cardiolipin synthase